MLHVLSGEFREKQLLMLKHLDADVARKAFYARNCIFFSGALLNVIFSH